MSGSINFLPPASNPIEEVLYVKCNGKTLEQWKDINVIRSLESFPSSFEIVCSQPAKFPPSLSNTTTPDVIMKTGDKVEIFLGKTPVLTGYCDTIIGELTSDTHNARCIGRSLCEDLHDCSAEIVQLPSLGLKELATDLCKPFGIKVVTEGKYQQRVYKQIAVNLTQTGFEIIDMVARYSQIIVYDNVLGQLVLAASPAGKMASGVAEGNNLLNALVTSSWASRYSEYVAVYESVYILGSTNPSISGKSYDTDIKRPRKLVFQSENPGDIPNFANERALWERNIRAGRSNPIKVVVDSWRDTSGALWRINHTIPVSIPSLNVPQTDWLITSAVFRKNLEIGTITELTLMPTKAFQPQPINPLSNAGYIASALQGNNK